MPVVNGTLKYFNGTRTGNGYMLKGEWDDGEDSQWVTTEAAEVLFEEGLVKEDGTFKDGGKKYRVKGNPVLAIEKHIQKGRPPTMTIHLGTVVENEPDEPPKAQPESEEAPSFDRKRWAELMHRYAASLKLAEAVWREEYGEEPDLAQIQAGAATIFIEAGKLGLKAPRPPKKEERQPEPPSFEDLPEPLEPEDDDLPF